MIAKNTTAALEKKVRLQDVCLDVEALSPYPLPRKWEDVANRIFTSFETSADVAEAKRQMIEEQMRIEWASKSGSLDEMKHFIGKLPNMNVEAVMLSCSGKTVYVSDVDKNGVMHFSPKEQSGLTSFEIGECLYGLKPAIKLQYEYKGRMHRPVSIAVLAEVQKIVFTFV